MNTFVLSRIQSILSDVFSIPPEQITTEASPETIEAWDSMNHLNLLLAIEQEFGVQFKPEEMAQHMSVKDIATLLDKKLNTVGSSS